MLDDGVDRVGEEISIGRGTLCKEEDKRLKSLIFISRLRNIRMCVKGWCLVGITGGIPVQTSRWG